LGKGPVIFCLFFLESVAFCDRTGLLHPALYGFRKQKGRLKRPLGISAGPMNVRESDCLIFNDCL
jgi:hypothetical protein